MSKIVKPYNNSQNKKNQVKQMFNKIAGQYDFLNRFLTFGIDNIWRKIAVKKIKNSLASAFDIKPLLPVDSKRDSQNDNQIQLAE